MASLNIDVIEVIQELLNELKVSLKVDTWLLMFECCGSVLLFKSAGIRLSLQQYSHLDHLELEYKEGDLEKQLNATDVAIDKYLKAAVNR